MARSTSTCPGCRQVAPPCGSTRGSGRASASPTRAACTPGTTRASRAVTALRLDGPRAARRLWAPGPGPRMTLLRALIGIAFFCLVAWALSSDRRRVPWRVVLGGLAAQAGLAWFVLGTEFGSGAFDGVSAFFVKLIGMTDAGTAVVFGPLAKPEVLAPTLGAENAFILAFKGLPVIVFFSALMAVLYHLGVMQVVVWGVGKVMSRVLGVSGAESMSGAANVLCGMTEALIRCGAYSGPTMPM
ncbi:MAG TPA: Na+ dependent nucleoside transporter N-terminal domain-containing protein [Planctomycetota bacterium]|nr:Na+ dependent nucleoside transporter N-terminal domain-containing protein [Planctomycetota bacterium]